MVFLRLLRPHRIAQRNVETADAGRDRRGIRSRPRQEQATDFLRQQRHQGRRQCRPRLKRPLGPGVHHALDPSHHIRRRRAHLAAGSGIGRRLVQLAPHAEVGQARPAAQQVGALGEMGIEQPERALERGFDDRPGLLARSDEAQPSRHAVGHHRARLGDAERPLPARHLQRDAFGRRPAVGLVVPAVVEHRLVQPLVAIFLEQRRDEGDCRIVGHDRWLARGRLEMLDDRRRVLNARTVRRDDQRDQRQLGVLLEIRLIGRRARQPVVRQSLVAEIRPHLHRIGREFRSEEAEPVAHSQRFRRSHQNRPPTMTTTRNQKKA